jgi:hypothetical protein
MSKARILAADDRRYFRDLLEGLLDERGIVEFGRAVLAPREALWPFAGHGILGTIFLLGSRVGASAAGLAQASASLAARPFHVVMLGEGEQLSPDDLRNNLSLMDDASLFLLPIEPEKDPSSVLRSLLARIVP